MDTLGGEAGLVRRAVAGDEVALKVLLTCTRLELCRYIGGKIPATLRRFVDPDDIVQGIHVRVFQRVAGLESDRPETFHRWVKTIALRHLRNTIKHYLAAKRGGGGHHVGHHARKLEDSTVALFETLIASSRTPSRSVARIEAIDAVEAALSSIPAQYSEAVRLVHLEDLSVREAAERMGKTERAIHGLCRRGLKELQQRLGNASRFLSSAG